MTVSADTRRQAILICAIAASDSQESSYSKITSALGIETGSKAHRLALAAWDRAYDNAPIVNGWPDYEFVDGEAECLLQTGWSPRIAKR